MTVKINKSCDSYKNCCNLDDDDGGGGGGELVVGQTCCRRAGTWNNAICLFLNSFTCIKRRPALLHSTWIGYAITRSAAVAAAAS